MLLDPIRGHCKALGRTLEQSRTHTEHPWLRPRDYFRPRRFGLSPHPAPPSIWEAYPGIVREGTDNQIYTLALTGYTWGIRHIRKEKEFRYLCCTEEGVEPADDAQPTFPWHLFTGPKDIILQVLNDLGP